VDATAAMLVKDDAKPLVRSDLQERWARRWQPLGHTTLAHLPAPADCGLVSGKS